MFGLFGSRDKIKTFTPAELRDFLRENEGACVLVDVREDHEWAGGHIPGAVHAPLSRFAEAADKLPKDKSLIFYCQGGVRSKRALDTAKEWGRNAEGHLGGGISAWRSLDLPVTR
ncbi:rhodanese-like domain-containing protein [uncultured Rhodoblastus sp.]|uniref:rhodanese-like domain-containing protein n=1 Tax=uncultured Rhodoblastus sp. TaxID=543037 RepID=UPI0025D11C05|nr:rhodanese-like domain-containing protein [uncultured Rhodoblastus sp.]